MTEQTVQPTEREELESRATTLGIKFHPNIGDDKLREKVAEALSSKPSANDGDNGDTAQDTDGESVVARRQRLKRESSELVRIRVTCMNPNKREYDGDIFTAGNRTVGTFKKYVPFDTEWHVPRIIFKMLKRKKCQVFVTRRDERGRQVREGKMINEFNVEVLPPLTEEERRDLAQRQAMAKGTAAA